MRLYDKIKRSFRFQQMPKYQHLYLRKERGQLRIKNGGGVATVTNCYYDPHLASYMYWLDANGVMVVVPECNLEPV